MNPCVYCVSLRVRWRFIQLVSIMTHQHRGCAADVKCRDTSFCVGALTWVGSARAAHTPSIHLESPGPPNLECLKTTSLCRDVLTLASWLTLRSCVQRKCLAVRVEVRPQSSPLHQYMLVSPLLVRRVRESVRMFCFETWTRRFQKPRIRSAAGSSRRPSC